MQRIFCLLLLLSLLCPVSSASGWYCGNEIIKKGDTKFKVLERCGEPDYREVISTERSHIKVEVFIYKERKDRYILTFRGIELTNIESRKE